MKTLLILRHAKSSWKDPSLADHDRPLKKRGRRDAPRMGQLIQEEGLVPDLILSSTARRARDTAEAVADNCSYDGELIMTRDLYHSGPEDYLYVLQNLEGDDHDRVMVVGHNPGLEDFLELLTDEYERLPTAAMAQVELPIESWRDIDQDIQGELINLWRPREL
jgi:phosphohistidine phosphatase